MDSELFPLITQTRSVLFEVNDVTLVSFLVLKFDEFDCTVKVNKAVHHKCIYCIVANTKLFLTFAHRH
jgi:hypothetical protein